MFNIISDILIKEVPARRDIEFCSFSITLDIPSSDTVSKATVKRS